MKRHHFVKRHRRSGVPVKAHRRNPLTSNVKWGLVIGGGVVGAGLLAYFLTRPASAAAPTPAPAAAKREQ